jgi:PilZ domain
MPDDVYVCWGSVGYDDTSQVRDLGPHGLFVLTHMTRAIGEHTNLHFLVEEGQIKAEAVVRHVKPGRGLGLEFTAVCEEDRRRLADLLKRLREIGMISKSQRAGYNEQAPLH